MVRNSLIITLVDFFHISCINVPQISVNKAVNSKNEKVIYRKKRENSLNKTDKSAKMASMVGEKKANHRAC